MAKKSYVVTAPYVTLATNTDQGPRVVGFYEGAAVPSDVSEEQIKHHLANNLIGEAPDEPAPSAAPDESEPPARNASKDAWKTYAVSQGLSEDDAEAASRDELAEQYLGSGSA